MGREIRKVPGDWKHPVYTSENARSRDRIGDFMPLHDEDFETAASKWEADFALWLKGAHKSHPSKAKYFDADMRFWEYSWPPDREHHRERKWTDAEATHFQVYETVSEGTPVTPAFATREELIAYLAEHGDFWDQNDDEPWRRPKRGGWGRKAAESFVGNGYAPSMIVTSGPAGTQIYEARDGVPPPAKESSS